MWSLRRTRVWSKDSQGNEVAHQPLAYKKDETDQKVLIIKLAESGKLVPLKVDKESIKNSLNAQVVARKQPFTINKTQHRIDEFEFRDSKAIDGIYFHIGLRPSLVRRFYLKLVGAFNKFRGRLKSIRKKNEKLYDAIAKWIGAFWEVLMIVLGFLPTIQSGLFTVIVCVSFAIVMAFMLGSERNRADRLVEDEGRKCEGKIKEYEQKVRQHDDDALNDMIQQESEYKTDMICKMMDLARSGHEAAHSAKQVIADIRMAQNKDLVMMHLVQYLKKCADDLESQLSAYYNDEKICVSFKLAFSDTEIKTYTRGKTNMECRGIIGVPADEEPVKISTNTAYRHIFEKKHSYFVCGDLRKFKEEQPTKNIKFVCEYGSHWKELFVSTIVIPIRWRNTEEETYIIAGVICVDCKRPMNDWYNTSSYAYHVVAHYADLLYLPIEEYYKMNQQKSAKEAS